MLDKHNYYEWPLSGRLIDEEEVKVGEREDPPPITLSSTVDAVVSWTKTAEDTGPTVSPKKLWRHRDASPAVLMLALLDSYGPEVLEWEAETVKLTLERDGKSPSNSVWTKILAGRTILLSPSPWRQWEVFHWVCRALAGIPPNFVFLEIPELGHLLAGYELMQVFDPKRETSYEVDKFVAAAFRNEGIPYIPAPLDFAQAELENARVECLSCGAVHRDDNDVSCVTCGAQDLAKVPYEYEDLRDAVKKGWKRLSKLELPQAVEELEKLPEEVAVPLRTLLVHTDYARTVRNNTAAQIRGMR